MCGCGCGYGYGNYLIASGLDQTGFDLDLVGYGYVARDGIGSLSVYLSYTTLCYYSTLITRFLVEEIEG